MPGSAGQRALVFWGATCPSITMVAPAGTVRKCTRPLPSGMASFPRKRASRPPLGASSWVWFALSRTGAKLESCPGTRLVSKSASRYPVLRTLTRCSPFSRVSLDGVTWPESLPSIQMLAPEGLEVTITLAAWARTAETGILLPGRDSTLRVCGRYPSFENTTLCAPGMSCEALKGVTQLMSLWPSTSTLAPPGCEVKVSSLSRTGTVLGLGCFLGLSGDLSSPVLPSAASFTVVSGAICASPEVGAEAGAVPLAGLPVAEGVRAGEGVGLGGW